MCKAYSETKRNMWTNGISHQKNNFPDILCLHHDIAPYQPLRSWHLLNWHLWYAFGSVGYSCHAPPVKWWVGGHSWLENHHGLIGNTSFKWWISHFYVSLPECTFKRMNTNSYVHTGIEFRSPCLLQESSTGKSNMWLMFIKQLAAVQYVGSSSVLLIDGDVQFYWT